MSASVQHTLSGNTFFIWLFYLFPLAVRENSKGVLKKPAHSSQRARANLFDLKEPCYLNQEHTLCVCYRCKDSNFLLLQENMF